MGYDKGGEGDGDIFSPFPLTPLHGLWRACNKEEEEEVGTSIPG